MSPTRTIHLRLNRLHPAQQQVYDERRRFNVLCAGRRLGKSRFGIRLSADTALTGKPVGWYSPTYKMLAELWRETRATLAPVTTQKNEQEKRLELITGGVIEFWSLDAPETSRGRRYARVIVDEAAMVSDLAEVWDMVIRPTLIDYAGDAWFLSTPKGRDDFAAMYDLGQSDDHPDWASWRFASTANPYLPADELDALRSTMTSRAYEQEIEARFIDELTDALWSNALIDGHRVARPPEMRRVVVAIDPAVSASADSDETGIVAAGLGVDDHAYVLTDASGRYSPLGWASKAIAQYDVLGADRVIGEVNNGGDLIRSNLRAVRATVPYKAVRASRGKATRAEPVAAMYEQGRVHHVGVFPELELQMTTWSPQDDKTSPDRVDALVWALSELMVKRTQRAAVSVQG